MSSTESRSGFRLPWSSDRSHESQTAEEPVEVEVGQDGLAGVAWPDSDFNARLGVKPTQPRPVEPLPADEQVAAADADTHEAAQESAMVDTVPTAAPAPSRKPSKLMADLSAAIRATADAAREEALARVDEDVAVVVEEIRAGSKEGEADLKRMSDEDIARIREWSKAEIARIKEETEGRIEARKSQLGDEIAAHAAEIEGRVGGVEAQVAAYRNEMAAYAERLAREDDPARLATMAESMPEPPVLAGRLPEDEIAGPEEAAAEIAGAVIEAEAVAGAAWVEPAVVEPEAVVEAEVIEAVVEPEAFEEPEAVVEAVVEPEVFEAEAVEAVLEAEAVEVVEAEVIEAVVEPEAFEAEAVEAVVEAEAVVDHTWDMPTPWSDQDPQPAAAADQLGDDVPRWTADAAPEGFPEAVEGGEPVDRGAIMAALEAAAEAVVAAEAAAESADQAEAAADVAETAAELVVGRSGPGEDVDPEAQAAFSARVGAGGFDTESFTDRLASLMPGHEPAVDDGSSRTTQVIVNGLVSVASIASFKRHLGRIGGVEGVAVASGPEGEFLFNVTHRADVSFRDAVPSMPGFAARVTGTADGVVTVSARDPEAEG